MEVFLNTNIEQLLNNSLLHHLRGCLFIPSGRRWETIPLRVKPHSHWAVADDEMSFLKRTNSIKTFKKGQCIWTRNLGI